MADWQTFSVIHDFARGSSVDRQETVAGGSVARIPAPYYEGDSFRLVISCWQSKVANIKSDFGATATVKLWITRYGVSQTPTELCTGAVSESVLNGGYDTLTFDVPAGATDGYGGNDCLVYAVIAATGKQRTVTHRLAVSALDDGANNPYASEMPYVPSDATDWPITEPDDVGEALDLLAARNGYDLLDSPGGATVAGLIYRLSGGAWVLADPDDLECETCELWIAGGTDPETDGMFAVSLSANVGWSFATVGKILWLDEDGGMTETVPTSVTHANRVARRVGWVRSATSARFDGHLPGDTFEEVSS